MAGVVGLAAALRLVRGDARALVVEGERQRTLGEVLRSRLAMIPNGEMTGALPARLPNNVSWAFGGLEGGDLVSALDLEGVAASTGSACTSGSTEPSHVLQAMGVNPDRIRGSLRLTTGRTTTMEDVETASELVATCVERVRGAAPAVEPAGIPSPAPARA